MLARYYVYERHMRGGKSARKPGRGIRRLGVVEKKREKAVNHECVGELTG